MSEYYESYRNGSASAPEQTWVEAYYGLFGKKLLQDEVDAIEGAVKYAFRNHPLKPWELVKAIRSLAADTIGSPRKFSPTGEEIIRAIYENRRRFAARALAESVCFDGYPPHELIPPYPRFDPATGTDKPPIVEPPQVWMDKLRKANPRERWDIICAPRDESHVEQRMEYCRLNGLPFEDRSGEVIANFKAALKTAVQLAVSDAKSHDPAPTRPITPTNGRSGRGESGKAVYSASEIDPNDLLPTEPEPEPDDLW